MTNFPIDRPTHTSHSTAQEELVDEKDEGDNVVVDVVVLVCLCLCSNDTGTGSKAA